MILLDIWMPDLDGVTLLRRWSDAGLLDIPVVVMSGHATIDTAVEAMKLGAVEVLEKPIAMTRLLRAVENALARRAGTGANPFIQQTDFGSTPAMRKLKGELLGAASEGFPALFLGAADSFSRSICVRRSCGRFSYTAARSWRRGCVPSCAARAAAWW